MLKYFLLSLFFFCFIACGKSKPVLLYDETKTLKKDIVMVNVPNDIEVVKVDDKFVDTPMSNSGIDLFLANGPHNFTLKYYCMWKGPSGDTNLLKSKKITIEIKLEQGKSYQIIHKPINNYEQALLMEKSPLFLIKELSTSSEVATKDTPAKEVSMPSKTVNEDEKVKPTSDKKSLDVLKLIWENSSEEDKKEFLKWLEKEKK